jgi:putative effector of murein hydrolase
VTALVHSLVAIGATLCVYRLSVDLHRRAGSPALLHPALTAMLAMGAGLRALDIAHADYFAAAWPIHAALTPMVVLLAVPLCRQQALLLAAPGRLAAIVALGALVAFILSAGLATVALADPEIVRTLLAKSVTTPVAIAIAESVGGLPELAPAIVIATGIVGACLGPWICRMVRVDDPRAVGLALGIASHVIGTARAFQISETAGAYATVGLVLNAILTSAAIALAFTFT